MYRWPIELEPPADGAEREGPLWLEIAPRGAALTLPSLMHLGHPVHLALLDAYLRGAVPFPRGAGLGRDSRAVVASLAAPLVLMYRLGAAQGSLLNLLLLPPHRPAVGHSRFIAVTPDEELVWLSCASAPAGRPSASLLPTAPPDPPWRRVTVAMPDWEELRARAAGRGQAPLRISISEPPPSRPLARLHGGGLLAGLHGLALGRAGPARASMERAMSAFGRATRDGVLADTVDNASHRLSLLQDAVTEAAEHGIAPSAESERLLADLRQRAAGPGADTPSPQRTRRRAPRREVVQPPFISPRELARLALGGAEGGGKAEATTEWDGVAIDVAVAPARDGGATLALLPRDVGTLGSSVLKMRDVAWTALEGLLDMPLRERRTEVISMRLTGPERASELSIGWSLILPRNRRVFAAWLGSDGRALLRLTGRETPR